MDSPLFPDSKMNRISEYLFATFAQMVPLNSESEKLLLEEIFENSPAFIAVLSGPEFVFERVNARYYELIGHRQVIGKRLKDALPEVMDQGFPELLEKVFSTGEKFVGEEVPVLLQRLPGGEIEERFIDLVYQRTRDKNGVPLGVFAHGVDVTEKVLTRKRIEDSEKLYRSFADAMPHMAWSTLPDGFHDYYNDRWYEFTGVPHGSTDGEGWNNMFHPEDQERAWATWRQSLKTGAPYFIEYRLRHHSGEYRWTLGRAMPVRNSKGEITRWMGTCTDIHDIKENEEKLKRIQRELQASLQVRDEFLSVASHELKTPLTSLSLQNQSMRRNFKKGRPEVFSPENVNLLIHNTEKQVNRLVRLVDDMLDLSRIESGKLSFCFEKAKLSEIVLDVYSRLKEQLENAGCASEINIQDECLGAYDKARMEQVITNLLTNAMRYGRGKPIGLSVFRRERDSLFEITDNGVGIETENLEKIFQRFERLVNADEVSGLGLGLYISKQIVEGHRGKIWAESSVGRGSKFIVKIPLE